MRKRVQIQTEHDNRDSPIGLQSRPQQSSTILHKTWHCRCISVASAVLLICAVQGLSSVWTAKDRNTHFSRPLRRLLRSLVALKEKCVVAQP